MKKLFLPAKSKLNIDKHKLFKSFEKLPNNIAVVYSVQYEKQAREIRKLLKSKYNVTKFAQVLGCSKPNFPNSTKAVILIGDGKFHAISLASETKLPIYLYEGDKLIKISDKEINDLEKRQKAVYLKFLNSNKVGILVSTKFGQQNIAKAFYLKNKLDKNSYILIGDLISASEFENFGLDVYINTACPRLDMESNLVINSDKLISNSKL